jgi:hypothetical protein
VPSTLLRLRSMLFARSSISAAVFAIGFGLDRKERMEPSQRFSLMPWSPERPRGAGNPGVGSVARAA